KDFRDVVRSTVIEPLGLGEDLFMGVGPAQAARLSDMHYPPPLGGGPQNDPDNNSPEWRRAGIPGGGGYGTARGMAALYQMMLADGVRNSRPRGSPRPPRRWRRRRPRARHGAAVPDEAGRRGAHRPPAGVAAPPAIRHPQLD